METYLFSAGLLWESDIVSLSGGLRLGVKYLHDDTVGARHRIAPDAVRALRPLLVGCSGKEWLRCMRRLHLTSPQINQLIHFLNDIAGLQVKRSFRVRVMVWVMAVERLLQGYAPAKLAQRRTPDWRSLSLSVSAVLLPVAAAMAPTAVFAYGLGFAASGALLFAGAVLCSLWFSLCFHEYIHLRLAARKQMPVALIRRGRRLGILHRPAADKEELLSALLGPFGGGLAGAVVCFIFAIFTNYSGLLIGAGCIMALLHMASLLPSYGDGRVIWKGRDRA